MNLIVFFLILARSFRYRPHTWRRCRSEPYRDSRESYCLYGTRSTCGCPQGRHCGGDSGWRSTKTRLLFIIMRFFLFNAYLFSIDISKDCSLESNCSSLLKVWLATTCSRRTRRSYSISLTPARKFALKRVCSLLRIRYESSQPSHYHKEEYFRALPLSALWCHVMPCVRFLTASFN